MRLRAGLVGWLPLSLVLRPWLFLRARLLLRAPLLLCIGLVGWLLLRLTLSLLTLLLLRLLLLCAGLLLRTGLLLRVGLGLRLGLFGGLLLGVRWFGGPGRLGLGSWGLAVRRLGLLGSGLLRLLWRLVGRGQFLRLRACFRRLSLLRGRGWLLLRRRLAGCLALARWRFGPGRLGGSLPGWSWLEWS